MSCLDDELLNGLDPGLSAVAVDNQTPPHTQLLQSHDNGGLPTGRPAANERGDPTIATNDPLTDVTSALNSSEVRVVRRRRDGFSIRCDKGVACWRPMVTTHWPRLLRQFGFSVDSR